MSTSKVGLWFVEDRFAPQTYLVRHGVNGNVPDKSFTTRGAAEQFAEKLNADERIRDAAPALLAACRAALEWMEAIGYNTETGSTSEVRTMKQLFAAIKLAEGQG